MPKYDDKLDAEIILADALLGSADGAIERREAAGQQAMAASTDLPKNTGRLTHEEITEHTGIIFGDDVNDLFVQAILPAGWSKQPTDHSMHTDLVDDQGRKRGGIFYKAAYYDRKADLHFRSFYTTTVVYEDGKPVAVVVNDGNGQEQNRFLPARGEDIYLEPWRRADAWVEENYPNNSSPWAYW